MRENTVLLCQIESRKIVFYVKCVAFKIIIIIMQLQPHKNKPFVDSLVVNYCNSHFSGSCSKLTFREFKGTDGP